MTPTDLIRLWIKKFIAADIDGLANLYALDAINDQVVFSAPLKGRESIRAMFETDPYRGRWTATDPKRTVDEIAPLQRLTYT